MHVRASTLRGRGVEVVSGGCKVAPEALRIRHTSEPEIEIGYTASISLRELGTIVEFLRGKGIVIDPDGEKQRQKLQTIRVIKAMAERGWLNDQGRKMTERVWNPNAAPTEQLATEQPHG